MKYGDNYVVTGPCVILWDGVTKPETNDSGKLVHSIKVAMLPTAPEVAELTELATACLNVSEFKGVLPPGGNWPLRDADPAQFEGKVAGHTTINAKTYNGAPQVFDANQVELAPLQYGSMLYPGAIVELIVHPYSYNNKQKGVSFGLDGIKIVDAAAPRLAVGGVDAAAAFGGAPAVAPAVGAPAVGSPAVGAPAVGAPAVGSPSVGAPAVGAPAVGAPAVGAPAVGAPAVGAVAPAPDFLNPETPHAPTMTAKAAGASYDSFIAKGWTDATLLEQGYIV